MWKDLSFKERAALINKWTKEHHIDYANRIQEYDATEAKKFADGGDTNPMGYEYRGTIHSDDLKNEGITHVVELPEVQIRGRDLSKPVPTAFDPHYDWLEPMVEFTPVVGDALDTYNAYNAVREGSYGEAAMLGAGLLLPNVLEKPAKFLLGKVGKLSKTLIEKGWRIGDDGFAIAPNGARFARNSEGKLVSEESLINELQAQKAYQQNVLAPIAAKEEARKKAQKLYGEFDRMGLDFSEDAWFEGRKTGLGAVTEEDKAFWRSHLPEYRDKAKELIDSGTLYQKDGKWFASTPKGEISVRPEDFIVSQSEAFKRAGLKYDGVDRMSAMTDDAYREFLNNGGLGVTTWTTDNTTQGNVFLGERSRKRRGKLVRSLVSGSGPVKHVPSKYGRESREVYHGLEYSPNVPYRGTTGNYTLFGHDMQMKALRGNNGNFDMGNFHPFRVVAPLAIGTTALGYFGNNE